MLAHEGLLVGHGKPGLDYLRMVVESVTPVQGAETIYAILLSAESSVRTSLNWRKSRSGSNDIRAPI